MQRVYTPLSLHQFFYPVELKDPEKQPTTPLLLWIKSLAPELNLPQSFQFAGMAALGS